MIIEFSIENFRSIKDRISLSMIATSLDSKNTTLQLANVAEVSPKLSLLRSAVIYGANASGKSNVIKAFVFFRRLIADSARESQADDPIKTEPFALQKDTRDAPSTFEVVFLLEGTQYRYGFSVTQQSVVKEWLYHTLPGKRESTLFTRDEEIHIPSHSPFREGRGLERRTRKNALFLSVVAQFDGEIALKVRSFLYKQCHALSTSTDKSYIDYTQQCIEEGTHGVLIDRLIKELDLDIVGLSIKSMPDTLGDLFRTVLSPESEEASNKIQFKEIQTRHIIRDANGETVGYEDFPLNRMESEGTQKIIALCGPLFDVLMNGWVLLLDEIDARLHPLITRAIVQLFHSPETNPKNAQLICVTHDTNLLDRKLFRRDQIYFTEKNQDATQLYSLADFKMPDKSGKEQSVRNDASFERNYIEGRYGAIPFLGDFRSLFTEESTASVDNSNSDPAEVSTES